MTGTKLRDPEALVSVDWLDARLTDKSLRIFDCSTYLEFTPDEDAPYRVVSAADKFVDAHIPGSACLDLQRDFSAQGAAFSMTALPPDDMAAAFARAGVSDDSHVVLYSRNGPTWAARFWWMLRYVGFDRVSILDGGFPQWQATGKAVESGPSAYAPGHLTPAPRPGVFVGKDALLAAIDDPQTVTINALMPDVHSGQNPRYGRPGRIPGSVNIPAPHLFDTDTHLANEIDRIAEAFDAVGAREAGQCITYCGGGIFATWDAFLLYQLGQDNIAVYDNSMSEWATTPELPMETD
ncbi:sulfurtransferase [Shimia biformata]|uniref:sulfurtransferase n=1 Tax=Shimia biformata TaxID=1294299 RepID=UPI00194E950E|nr:rhodanese-like domain-containing protein [Shimia biformata]